MRALSLPDLYTPLMAACASTKQDECQITECVKRLIEAGANVNAIDRSELYWFSMSPKTYAQNALKQQFKIYTIAIMIHCHLEVNLSEVDATNFCQVPVVSGTTWHRWSTRHARVTRLSCADSWNQTRTSTSRTPRVTPYVATIYRFCCGHLKSAF